MKQRTNAQGRSKAKSQPFVQLFKSFLREPAWLDLSFGARALHLCLKSYHNGENNGSLYLAARKAAKQIGCNKASIPRWFKELDEHGFIRKTQGHVLGLEGDGKAAHWRLTEHEYMGEKPTFDYKNWAPKKQNPVRIMQTTCTQNAETEAQNADTPYGKCVHKDC